MAAFLYFLGIVISLTAAVWVLRRTTYSTESQVQLEVSTNPSPISKKLAEALPHIVLLHREKAFRKSINSYWAQQERGVMQACIVQPREASEVAKVIEILRREYDEQEASLTSRSGDVLFAVRGGACSQLTFYICGLSFFTPRFGLACSNVLAYEVVLASGKIVTATAQSYSDLWRTLKGGSNNFGVVTRFTVRCFPSTKIRRGFIYAPNSQSTKALMAFYESVKRANPKISGANVDSHAAAPITCFTYVQRLGIQTVTVHLAYTNPSEEPRNWPMTPAIIEMSSTCPPGQRWSFGTTTIKNDLPTLLAARADLDWTIAMQPLLPSWAAKGDANVLGVREETDYALVILSFSVYWQKAGDDQHVYATIRETIERIEAATAANGTGHRSRYLNYCAQWQQPLEGYGEGNLRFLTEVSRKHDPDGLFQRGCTGGFK
ncbi:hypothetical protein BDV09DRAFT_182111 [Aspergillus tetrazonus]